MSDFLYTEAEVTERATREGWLEWLRSPLDMRAARRGCWFDLKAYARVMGFFQKLLRHTMGEWAGQPFEPLEWQRVQVLGPLFGWKRADGTRRYRRAGIWIPKKNGKSSLCSGLALYLLCGDNEPGAQVYCAATDRQQAGIVFNEAWNMVRASPALAPLVKEYRVSKTLEYPSAASYFRALSGEFATNEGLNIHALIFDELHAQADRRLFDALRFGGEARRQPLLITISTAGYDRLSIGYEECEYARKVLDGTIDTDEFLPVIYEATDTDDWTSPATWEKANPSLGVTIKRDRMETACREAQDSPAKENAFRRYRLNQWTQQDVRWLQMARWDACAGMEDALALRSSMEGQRCFAGLDLATTQDMTALSLVFPEEADDGTRYTIVPYYWIPSLVVDRRVAKDHVPYDQWIKGGWLFTTDGDYTDFQAIRRFILELRERFDIAEIPIDKWGAPNLMTQLGEDGFEVVAFPQGFSGMAAPCKELEAAVLGGRIRHGGHPILRWNMGNVAVDQNAEGHLRPSKKKSTERIDGAVATLMGLSRASLESNGGKSIYDLPGSLSL